MLHIVAKNDSPRAADWRGASSYRDSDRTHQRRRTGAGLEAGAQRHAGVDELRLIVRALADIREALRSCEWVDQATALKQPRQR